MKKLLILLSCCFMSVSAFADVAMLENNCSFSTAKSCHSADEYLNIDGFPGCLECDDKECAGNTSVLARDARIGSEKYSDGQWHRYTCETKRGNDKWTRYPGSIECPNDPLAADPNVKLVPYTADGYIKTANQDGIIAVIGGKNCLKRECKDGFRPVNGACMKMNGNCPYTNDKSVFGWIGQKLENETCTPLSPSTNLNKTEHVKDLQKSCVLECTQNGWNVTLKEDGCETNYVPDNDKKACVESDETVEERERNACEKSGGSWNKDTKQCECATQKHLVPKEPGKTCNCVNGYMLQNKVCILTDEEKMKRACKEINKPYLELGKTCDCRGDGYMFEFVLGKGCVLNSAYAACISDAAVASGSRWKDGSKKCGCGDKEPDYYWNIEQELCVKSEKLINQENANQITAKVSELDANITKGLDGWQKTLSVWKTEEGKFNTARLASDSIAGVVLGTAGGLITSKVVKKNQVKSGFEDIECTVGGQKVADWHDEFTVGVQ